MRRLSGGRGGIGPPWWRREALDRADDSHDLLVVALELVLELGEPVCEFLMRREEVAQPDECANDKNAHLNRAGSVEHGSGHDGAVLGEGGR